MNSHPARCLCPLPILSLLLLASFCATAMAQLPAARLANIFPPGGQSGGTTEVSVAGTDLDGLRELWFSHRGITAANVQSNRFQVAIAKDVPPGDYEVRAVGKYGATNPRTFSVGALAEFREEQNSLDSPQAVKLESTINGRIDANSVDYFRFEAKA